MKTLSVGALALAFLIASSGCGTKEELSSEVSQGEVHKLEITPNPVYTPSLHVVLPDSCPVPDGMTVEESTGKVFLNVPNFAPVNADGSRQYPARLGVFDKTGNFELLLEYPNDPDSGKAGPMGLDFGPDGNLYVADNQFFSSDPVGRYPSRILRVEMKDGKPTGKIDVVVAGLRLANAILIHEGFVYVSDTNIDLAENPGKFGLGIIWRFKLEDILNAKEPIKVDPTVKNGVALDSRAWVVGETKKIGRGDNSSFDGLTWAWGALYAGNFGDGQMYRIETNDDGAAKVETILDDDAYHCCDGIFYDEKTDKIYVNDSQANAIRTLSRTENGEHVAGWLWVNDDTNGENGLLDQPAECVVVDGVLYVANFDWAFPGLKNTTSCDKPYSISAIAIGTQSDAELAAEGSSLTTNESAPTVEAPGMENAAKLEETPQVEAASQAKEAPQVEAAPQAKEAPQVEAAPQTEETPQAEAASQAKESPQAEAASQAKEAPQVEAAPQAKEAPQVEAAPQTEEAPQVEAAPQAEETAAQRE